MNFEKKKTEVSQGRKTNDVPFQVSFPLNLAFIGLDISIRKLQNSQEKNKQTALFHLLSLSSVEE